MTAEEVKTAVRRHRTAAILGGVAGVAVLIGWIGYIVAMTPSKPVLQSATADEVIAYVANPRGLSGLPDVEQRQFLQNWQARMREQKYKDAMKASLERLDDSSREEFVDAIFRHLKKGFMDDARHFARLTDAAEQNQFVRQKVAEMNERAVFMKEIAYRALKSNFGGEDELRQWLLEHTSPKERQLGEPYVEALKRVGTQLRKEERSAAAPS